ncbi:FAD-dependent pyridine nucleotide-disulfide oxidoreductase [Desulfonema limicola]|uniref:FAD-dependent pyridine nucleotide-disulfide oxidoreductase n=1 Tax=Desulfonema limicola TaxID=45656 RepID=A0A975BB96_9BACT|nr:NAD(P)/FAD-dependent oxidoreductase [Desulfonema limicola]QTA82040.1 FAD-dependent pyridine nucleotide-disulfide oxidoreductase [Desulfonema limicola]
MTDNTADKYDLCILGCGPAGFAGAMRAMDLGKKVCIIEGAEIGGAGVMWGALASKTMWELAKDYAIAAKTDRGYRASGLTVDYCAVRATVIQAAKEKQYQMLSQIETFSPGRWKGSGSITCKRGWGKFISEKQVAIRYDDEKSEKVSADFFLIATGSTPRHFPNIKVDQQRIFDSDGILNLQNFPKRLVIIGAGIIGCEYATIFSNFGQTEVYLIDHASRVIPYEDEDISDFVNNNLIKNGVNVIHSAQVRDIAKRPDHLEVILDFKDGHSKVIEADAALISIGRTVDLSCLGLETLGVDTKRSGLLDTDENCCVKNNIYAAGDITHNPALVNIAEMEARYAVKHMFGKSKWPLNYDNMSTVMFFYPAVAAIGLNEKLCQRKKIPYKVGFYSNSLCSRAVAMRSTHGFVKIIISDDKNQRILGMRAAGPQVSSTIMSIAHFMDQGKGALDVLKSVYPHPTVTEGIQECLRLLLNKSIYKPHAFPELLKINKWHPETGFSPCTTIKEER